jgi:hypothetical protein
LFDRYQAGDCRQVWDELTQLHATVRDPQHFVEASAVAHETMRRAKHNVEQIIEKLDRLGYRFTASINYFGNLEEELKPDRSRLPSLGNPQVFKPAAANAAERLDALEETIGGPLPLSVRHWWEQIGFVCLAGVHETLSPGDPDGASPLVIWEFDDEWTDLVDLKQFNGTGFQLSLERDAYAIRVPDRGADVKIRPDSLWFVPYLREVFEWGGFPAWAHKDWRPEKELHYLREDLLPI